MAQLVTSLITIGVILNLMLLATAYLIMLERKSAAWIQDRIGPNRVGFTGIRYIVNAVIAAGLLPLRVFGIEPDPDRLWQGKAAERISRFHFWGLGQPIADGLKFLMKEDYTPPGVDRRLFILAPMLAVVPAMIGWAVLPWGGFLAWGEEVVLVAAAPIHIGIIYILAVGSLAVYGVVVGGYASNNKYSFLGGLRATAQMLSYEIPMGLAVLIVVLASGTVRADWLVELQAGSGWNWNLFCHPLVGLIFFICLLAEANRAPFDLAEAEQELVGGYHTEYSSMKFALYFLGEYMHMISAAGFFTLLFLGGWDIPLVPEPMVGGVGWVAVKFLVFAAKIGLLLFLMMWIRWSLPRFRFDQLMRLAWRGLIPMSLVLLLATGLLVFFRPSGVETWGWTYFLANVAVAVGTILVAPAMPKGATGNRRVPLEGSRFSPATGH